MTWTHQTTNVSGTAASATSLPISYPAGISAGDVLVLEIGSKPFGTTTSGSSIGPLTQPAGWTLLGTRTNGTTAQSTDTGSVRGYVLAKIADGTETGSINLALASANSSGAAMHHWTRDNTKEISFQVTFGADATGGAAWSVAMGENPGLKVGDIAITTAVWPTDAVGAKSAPGLTATGLTASQNAQRANLNVTTGNDLGMFVNDWTVSGGPASTTPTWTQTLAATNTNAIGIGMLLRMREVTPNPAAAQVLATGSVDIPDLTGSVAAPALSVLTGDIIVAILSDESAPTTPTMTNNGSGTTTTQESQLAGSNNRASGRMWTYEAITSETVTLTFDNGSSNHARVRYWHVRGGTLTGMTKVSVQDTSSSAGFVSLPSVPTDALILGQLSDFNATSNTGNHLAWPVADDIIVDGDLWSTGESRWVSWHTWSNNTQQGPTLPTTMQACTFAIAIPPAATGPAPAATTDSVTPTDAVASSKLAAKATTDSVTPADRPVTSKRGIRALVDSTTPTDRPVGAKLATRAVADSTTPTDLVVSARTKTVTAALLDSTTPADRPAGFKSASGATSTSGTTNDAVSSARSRGAGTVESATPTDTTTGAKLAARSTVDSATPADRPTGAKLAAKSVSDSTTPADRPAGSKLASRAVADSVTPADRPIGLKRVTAATSTAVVPAARPVGSKSANGAVFDSSPTEDIASKVLVRGGPTSTAAVPRATNSGTKTTARAIVDSTTPADRPIASKSAARAVTDSVTPASRPIGLKVAIRVILDAVVPGDRLIGSKRTAGVSRSECVPASILSGSKRASGSTRTSTSPDDQNEKGLPFKRNVKIHGGSLDIGVGPASVVPRGRSGILRRYAPGHIGSHAPGGGVHGNP